MFTDEDYILISFRRNLDIYIKRGPDEVQVNQKSD